LIGPAAAHVDAACTETIIASSKRDYAWIMARLAQRVRELGYDVSKLQEVSQRW
jgi:hypothetical protein